MGWYRQSFISSLAWAFCLANESKRQRQEKRVVQQLLLPKTAYFVIVKRSNSEIQCTNWRTIILHCFTPCLRSNTSLVPIFQSPEILTLSRFQTKTASIFQFKTWMAFVLVFSWFKSFIQFENKQQAMEKNFLKVWIHDFRRNPSNTRDNCAIYSSYYMKYWIFFSGANMVQFLMMDFREIAKSLSGLGGKNLL